MHGESLRKCAGGREDDFATRGQARSMTRSRPTHRTATGTRTTRPRTAAPSPTMGCTTRATRSFSSRWPGSTTAASAVHLHLAHSARIRPSQASRPPLTRGRQEQKMHRVGPNRGPSSGLWWGFSSKNWAKSINLAQPCEIHLYRRAGALADAIRRAGRVVLRTAVWHPPCHRGPWVQGLLSPTITTKFSIVWWMIVWMIIHSDP
jgi:hypothetical protein